MNTINYFSASRIVCDEEHEMLFPSRSGRAAGCGCQCSPRPGIPSLPYVPDLSLPPLGAPRSHAVLWGCVPLLSTSQQQHCAALGVCWPCTVQRWGAASPAGLCLLFLLCATRGLQHRFAVAVWCCWGRVFDQLPDAGVSQQNRQTVAMQSPLLPGG